MTRITDLVLEISNSSARPVPSRYSITGQSCLFGTAVHDLLVLRSCGLRSRSVDHDARAGPRIQRGGSVCCGSSTKSPDCRFSISSFFLAYVLASLGSAIVGICRLARDLISLYLQPSKALAPTKSEYPQIRISIHSCFSIESFLSRPIFTNVPWNKLTLPQGRLFLEWPICPHLGRAHRSTCACLA